MIDTTRTGATPPVDDGLGPVPPDNRRGHRPDVDQDKPQGPPPTPPGSVPRRVDVTFSFDPLMSLAALPFGVVPGRTGVTVGPRHLSIRFGSWSLRTPLSNVAGAEVTGPYAWPKVAGPPHLSFADGGVTFATSTGPGVCIRFVEPVGALLPFGLIRHPAATVTVADPEALVAEIDAAVRRDRHAS
jgi:hypothetical protein